MKDVSIGNRGARGFSTLEMLLALAIISLALTAASMVVFGNQSIAADTTVATEALYKAQGMLEYERALSRLDYGLLAATTSTETSGGITYAKSVSLAQAGAFAIQATSTVSWVSGGRALSIVLSTLFTNASSGTSNTCSPILTGNWKNPQHYQWDLGQLGVNGNNGNGFGISNIVVFNKRLYLTMYTTPNTDKDTVFIFDTQSDPSQPPTFRGSVDNDPSNAIGPNALAVASTTSKVYAFVASASRATIQVVDVTDPTNPAVVKTFAIPTSKVSTAGTPYSLFYKNGYLYLGLSKITGGGPEFNIIDVGAGSGSPTNPVWVGGYDTGSAVNEIYLKGTYAYLTTAGNENLTVLDISTPSNPTRVGGFTPPNAPESDGVGSDHGESIFVLGTTAYLGRTYGTNEFYILNAATPSSISTMGSKDVGTGNQSGIYSVAVRNSLAFFITGSQFQVWNISNPANPAPWSADGTTATFLSLSSLGGTGTASDCEGNTFYLAIGSSQGNNKDVLGVITPGP